MKIPNSWLLALSIALSLFLLLSLFSTLTSNGIRIFFQSDTLYLPSIYYDLFRDHNRLQGWHLNPSPNFFPDMIVYFLFMALSGNFIVSSFIFSFIQYLAILLVILYIYRVIVPEIPVQFLSGTILLMTLFFLVTFYSKDFIFTFYIISNAYHTGAFLMGLVCVALTFDYLKRPRNFILILLFIFSLLSVVSDRLFIALYILPICAIGILPLKHQKTKEVVKIFSVNIAALIPGLLALRILANSHFVFIDSPNRIADFSNSKSSFFLLFKQLGEYAAGMNIKTLIIGGTLLSFCGLCIIFYRNIRKEREVSLLTTYSLFSAIYTVVVLFMPVINGKYTGYDTFRYNVYVFYLGIINMGILLYYLFSIGGKKSSFTSFVTKIVMIFGLYLLFTGFIFFSSGGLKGYFSYSPEIAKSLDAIKDAEHLKYGVANYWDAKLITMFSKKGIKVYPVHDGLIPYPHVTNENWFYAKNAEFNFFVINHVPDTSLYRNKIGARGTFHQYGDAQVIMLPGFRYEGGQIKMVK